MKRQNIISFVAISVFGTLLHFIYDWSNNSKFVGYFSAVNESTWEHLKLLFFPAVFYFIFEYFILKNQAKNYIPASAIGIFSGLLSIVVIFYSYRGILGFNVDYINIFIYYLAVIIMLLVKNSIIKKQLFLSNNWNILFLFLILLTAFSFILFTYSPPAIGIFTPPVNN